MEYSIGDRVVIVDMAERRKHPDGWNSRGYMDKYCGMTMTVKDYGGDHYIMEEDQNDERRKHGWCWYPEMIAGLAEEDDLLDTVEDTQLNAFLMGFKQG